MSLLITLLSETVAIAIGTAVISVGGTIFVAFIGFLQWRKSHKVETTKVVRDSEDKFRDDVLAELERGRQRMDSMMIVNAALMSEKTSSQILQSQQQNQIMELTRRSEKADLFERQVNELTRINGELMAKIDSQGAEILRLRSRILELEKGNHAS